jgi:hypothetical protein
MNTFYRAVVASVLVVLASSAASAQELLDESAAPAPHVRFQGEVQVGAPDARTAVQVELRDWILPPGLKERKLPLPEDATVIVELHGGKLVTLSGKEKSDRNVGTTWELQPGEPLILSTYDDSVSITTLVLRPR